MPNIKPMSLEKLKKELLKEFKIHLKDKSLNISASFSIDEPIASFEFRRKL